ncbi:hypothetical protein [Paraburkholderia sp. BCC1885]|uniref:hypothetical protein n=1 Tax=Paraburkholderia sp. BCC1885 TaxID=2562669 RepID=UPI0011832A39|nr:hypothetical protein [Paraburkholderia sp. BCC1885]
MIRYSKTTHSFYPHDIEYPNLPNDLIDVEDAEYLKARNRLQGDPGETFEVSDDGIVTVIPARALTAQEKAYAADESILMQIASIERDKQPRAVRDFILTGDKTRLQSIDSAVAALRAKLA